MTTKTENTTNELGIDVETKDRRALINRLKRLNTTVAVYDGGKYHQDHNYSQVHLDTVWTEEQLDNWLYKIKTPFGYVGTFTRK